MHRKRSYLFVTFEGGGNLPPVLGVVRRLASRGHRVTVLTEPCLHAVVEAAGGRFIPFRRHFTRLDRTKDFIGDSAARTPLGALTRTFQQVVFGPAEIVAHETREAILRDRPDVVVVDALLPGALPAAEAEGVPRVVLFHMPEYLPGPGRPAAGPGFLPRGDLAGRLRDGLLNRAFLILVRRFVPAFNRARLAMGLPGHASPTELLGEYHRAHRRLMQTAEAFDFPIAPPPPNLRYVGPMLDDPDWAGSWDPPLPAEDTRPLVVVGLSSTLQAQEGALRRIVAALGTLEVRGLVTLGPSMADLELDLPSNIRAVSAAPHSQVFPEATAVITHAGHGTVMRALALGLPLLCLPMGRDQDDNAARIVHAGAGIRLRPSASSARIAGAVERLLHEPGFRTHAERLGRGIVEEAREERAISELEELAVRVGEEG